MYYFLDSGAYVVYTDVMIKFSFNIDEKKRDAFGNACKSIGSHMGVELRKFVDAFIRKANSKKE